MTRSREQGSVAPGAALTWSRCGPAARSAAWRSRSWSAPSSASPPSAPAARSKTHIKDTEFQDTTLCSGALSVTPALRYKGTLSWVSQWLGGKQLMTDLMLVRVKSSSKLTAILLLPIRVTWCQNYEPTEFWTFSGDTQSPLDTILSNML